DRAVLKRMNNTLYHRGPDSEGFYIKDNVGLGMRRLKIIDLLRGDQPIHNEDATIWIVFNGEIYNYRELRGELKRKGHLFTTNTDTEVIVHLYEELGINCVERLRGMFAFSIWDEKQKRLILSRDRVGKKPLYYAQHDGSLMFGSEIKAILAYPGFPRYIDTEAIHHYLTLQYIPAPLTAFRDIKKLPPAHILIWQNGNIKIKRYWDLSYEPKLKMSGLEIRESMRELIKESVRIRLISDVPLGAHLSGGIDSSIIVGLMAGMMDKPVKTFSIGFKEKAFNELPYAKEVAEKFSTEHHEFIVEPDVIDIIHRLIEHFDEPFADPAALPTWYLSEMTRNYVTVALNGDGGDESFGGYQRYYADIIADAYGLIPKKVRNHLFRPLLNRLPFVIGRPMEKNYFMALRQLQKASELHHSVSIIRWGSYFDEAEKAALYRDEFRKQVRGIDSVRLLEESFYSAKALNRLDRTLYTDVHNYLPGALLPKVDRMTMAHSIEARSPFLDHKVMEMAARLPIRYKVRAWKTKWLLRNIFSDLIPKSIKNRGKVGFSVPLGMWFRRQLYSYI
ncbi:MAG: asparagine synthase (glutamine-hydrolyzing), partial [Nitrospirae bacterium]